MSPLLQGKKHKIIIKDRLGRLLHDLRISVTDQCNFRCPYCMPCERITQNSFLKKNEFLNLPEIVRIAHLTAQLGVKKIRLTGGEPLLHKDIAILICMLRKIDQIEDIALTTNGSLLAEKAVELKKSGLSRLTVSLDSLDEKVFNKMSGGFGSVKNVLRGITTAGKAGFNQIKINVVIEKNINDCNILDLVDFFRNTPHILRFIEFMDVGTQNNWKAIQVVPSAEIYRKIHKKYPLVALDANYPGEVANRYAFEDGKGEIGFISSISQPFCQDCSRLRLSPDGKLYACLFATEGMDVKTLLRSGASDETLFDYFKNFWMEREDRYSEKRFFDSPQIQRPKVEMYKIGG